MAASIRIKHSEASIGISNITLGFPEINIELPNIAFPFGNFFPDLRDFIYFPMTDWTNFWREFFKPTLIIAESVARYNESVTRYNMARLRRVEGDLSHISGPG